MEDNKNECVEIGHFYAKNYTPTAWYYPFWVTKEGSPGSSLPRATQEQAIQYLEKRLKHDKEQWICKMVNELVWEKNLYKVKIIHFKSRKEVEKKFYDAFADNSCECGNTTFELIRNDRSSDASYEYIFRCLNCKTTLKKLKWGWDKNLKHEEINYENNNKKDKPMIKQFEYRGYNFNITVDLNTKMEKHPNGKRWHTITINCIDIQDYNKTVEVEDAFLEIFIGNIECTAKEFIDNKEDGKKKNLDEQRLIELGFK